MTKEGNADFKNFTKCGICDNDCVDNDVIVRDNCHITGKYRDNFAGIPEKNPGANNFENNNYYFKILEHVTNDIQPIIVNHLTI